jgi:class 3 adenylate cyclase/pimeloyl-ACP methyl ester carboxylesterase
VADGRVRYVRNGDVRLAYRVYGDAETTLVWVPTMFSSIDRYDDPTFPWGAAVDKLSRELRVVVFDGRGTGLSDPVMQAPTLDDRVGDLVCVLDAAGADNPILFGVFSGGLSSIALAATDPARVRSLILYATAARFTEDPPDFPWGFTPAQVDDMLDEIEEHWGEGALADLVMGTSAEVPGVREQWGRIQSSLASPRMAALLFHTSVYDDVRDLMGLVTCPTLVAARPDDRMVPFEAAAALAAGIPGAQFVAFPPGAHAAFDLVDVLVARILDFCETPSASTDDRILATVLFTDIVGSTEQLGAAGDQHWSRRLDEHDEIVDRLLSRYGGRRVNHTGDGVFALFDVPSKAARCALELVPTLAGHGLRIRAGIHVGECERRGEEWAGLAVHTGARVCAMAGATEILCTRTLRDLAAGSGITFESLGPQQLKGLSAAVDVYRVTTG